MFKTLRPWYKFVTRRLWHPFDSIADLPSHVQENVKYSEEWCRWCQQMTKKEIDQGTFEGISVYRKRCQRCGQIMAYGLSRKTLTHGFSDAAMRFIQTTGRDRR